MAGTALTMANTSLSSNGPSRGRWCDSCMCHREACHSAWCAHAPRTPSRSARTRPGKSAQFRVRKGKKKLEIELSCQGPPRTATPTESANVPNILLTGTAPLQCMERRKISSIALQPLAHSRGHVMATYYWNNSTHSK
jgi:hypothetical protein